MTVNLLIFLLALLCFSPGYSYSACDSVDAIFLIDSDTIRDNLDGITEFIESIIHHGSSEDLGVSLYLYGDGINIVDELKLIDTFNTHRSNKSSFAIQHLKNKFFTAVPQIASGGTSSISLKEEFITASQQQQPTRYG